MKCTTAQVLQQKGFDHDLSAAIAGGVTGVLLSDPSGSDAAALYEAAIKLKGQLRGRAMLLIAERTDIVDASEADGVIVSQKGMLQMLVYLSHLSCHTTYLACGHPNVSACFAWHVLGDKQAPSEYEAVHHRVMLVCFSGVPAVVARRLLQQGGLVGCLVNSSTNAVKAAADGGADLIFLEVPACKSAVFSAWAVCASDMHGTCMYCLASVWYACCKHCILCLHK